MLHSSGKSVGAILIGIMVDKGLLDYNEPIVSYWPDFANKNKGNIKIMDLMRHESGLSKLSKPISWKDTLT